MKDLDYDLANKWENTDGYEQETETHILSHTYIQ